MTKSVKVGVRGKYAAANSKPLRNRLGYLAVAVWLTFTLSLSGWWLYFSLNQLEHVRGLESARAPEIFRHQKMLLLEGSTLLLCLIAGAVALIYYMFRVIRQNEEIHRFFAIFTHELRTPLASLKLQAESLKEDLTGQEQHQALLGRLVSDAERLSLQLENSLFLAQGKDFELLPEPIDLHDFVTNLAAQWPDLNIRLDNKRCVIECDQRALESIFRNIFQNSLIHGGAKNIDITIEQANQMPAITIKDDGRGFKGDRACLGAVLMRHAQTSGNGLGTFIMRTLVMRMGGQISFPNSANGFIVEVLLPGQLVK